MIKMIRIELTALEINFLKKYLKYKLEQMEWILNNKLEKIKDETTLKDNINILNPIINKLEKIKINIKDMESDKNV